MLLSFPRGVGDVRLCVRATSQSYVCNNGFPMPEVFRFALKRRRTDRTSWWCLKNMDLALCESLVSDGTCSRGITLKRQDCSEAIQQIARIRDGVFWIECELDDDPRLSRCLGMRLCVDAHILDERLAGNGVASEEFVVQLSRTVWRESVVPTAMWSGNVTGTVTHPDWWNPSLPLRPHQLDTLRWMMDRETEFPSPFQYDGNIRVSDHWYIDTEHECITNDPSRREAELRGGICADAPGSGKTATTLALMLSGDHRLAPTRLYASRASLVIVPLNLTSQWTNEIDKFTTGTRVLTMLSARDLRSVNMSSVCHDYDVVLTTFNFLRSCKAYLDLVDAAMGGRPRSRASLSAWCRQRNHEEPILEAVQWRRIVVDEIHQTFDASRDLRSLQLFDAHCIWGLSGTLSTDTDGAQHLYVLLAREKAHHPNMLSSLIGAAVRGHASTPHPSVTVHEVRRVHVSEHERLYVDDSSHDFIEVENEVRCLSFVDAMEGDESMEDAHARKQHRTQVSLTSQLSSLNHNTCVLERMCSELEREIDSGGGVVDGLRETLQQTTRELHHVQQRRNDITRRLEVRDNQHKHITGMSATSSDIGTKMREIGRLVSSFSATEPIVMFVQWKTMLRGTRTFLRNEEIRVFTLDGNSHQRTATLQEHLNGGVLLLCMEDSFAGLHLPHARNIIFAHAIVADVGTVKMLEQQAIARCVREGQTSHVTVHSFMVADSAEERHWTGTH